MKEYLTSISLKKINVQYAEDLTDNLTTSKPWLSEQFTTMKNNAGACLAVGGRVLEGRKA